MTNTSAPSPASAISAAVLFAIAAGYDAWHLVTGRSFGDLSRTPSVVLALVHVVVWSAAALLLVLHPVADRLRRASFGLSVAGAFLVFAHGLVLRGALLEPIGIAFVAAGLALGMLLKMAWTPFPWSRREPPSPPARTLIRTRTGQRHAAM